MAYLIQNRCITTEDLSQLRGTKSFDNNMKLIEILVSRGVTGFDSFVKALEEFTGDNPEEGAHVELLEKLKAKKSSKLRRVSTGASLHTQQSTASMMSNRQGSVPKPANVIAEEQGPEVEVDFPPQPQSVPPNTPDKTSGNRAESPTVRSKLLF